MKSYSTAELSRKIGDVTRAAERGPITITSHGKPRYILMSFEDFSKFDARKVYSTGNTPPDLAQELVQAMDKYLAKNNPRRKKSAA